MSIRRFFQIVAFLSALTVAIAAPLSSNADACSGGGVDGGGDC